MALPPADPPAGSQLADPTAQRVAIERVLGPVTKHADDPGYMPPVDPLKGGNLLDRAKLIAREIPLITIAHGWTVDAIRSALRSHQTGIFWDSAQLVDTMTGDDRIMATMSSRMGGLFGRPIVHRASEIQRVKGSDAARECLHAWTDNWERIAPESAIYIFHYWEIMMGFSPAQIVWDTTQPLWCPYLQPWHPAYVYYHWPLRKYVAITLDGQRAILAGDGKWMLSARFGEYRGWMHGAMRALAEPWAIRHFAVRDGARFSEVHGLPTRKGKVPAASDPSERQYFEDQLSNLGSAPAMIVPQGVDGPNSSYDYELVEAKATAWEAFFALIDRCDMQIVLTILAQNLTTEVKEGSFAAARVHSDVREGVLMADNRALSWTIYSQLARAFAAINFGDPDLAPVTYWDVEPVEDQKAAADMFLKFGTAIEVLARGGIKFDDDEEVRQFAKNTFGLKDLPSFKIGTPVSGGLGK